MVTHSQHCGALQLDVAPACACLCVSMRRSSIQSRACGTPAYALAAFAFVLKNEQHACICTQATNSSMSINRLEPPHKLRTNRCIFTTVKDTTQT
eukprot:4873129-Pleurochrysis_carterae.AAC.1